MTMRTDPDRSPWRGHLALTLATAVLAACGGGGSDEPAPPPVATLEGAYSGSLSSPTLKNLNLLVLENGQVWGLYGAETEGIFLVSGFVQGDGAASDGRYGTSNLRDFGVAPALDGSLTGSYDATATRFTGTLAVNTTSLSFDTTKATQNYVYDTPANVAALAGAWTMTSVGTATVDMTVLANGSFTIRSSTGCTGSGGMAPRASGKNVFNVQLTLGPAPCGSPGLALTGVALAYPVQALGKTQLTMALVDPPRVVGLPLIGYR
jgi:hypothetical protein